MSGIKSCIEIQDLESMVLKTIEEISKQLKAGHLYTENLADMFTEKTCAHCKIRFGIQELKKTHYNIDPVTFCLGFTTWNYSVKKMTDI